MAVEAEDASAIAGYTRDQVDLIKNTVAQGATDDELALFLHTARRLGLDPFTHQIHFIKRRQRRGQNWVEVGTIQVGIDGYRAIADAAGHYAPGREPAYTYDEQGRLLSATAYVKKLAGGVWHEVAASAFWDEYVQTGRDGKPVGMWGKMPHNQLAKCAEALALRRAFPQLSGVYTDEEMEQADGAAPAPSASAPADQLDAFQGPEEQPDYRARALKIKRVLLDRAPEGLKEALLRAETEVASWPGPVRELGRASIEEALEIRRRYEGLIARTVAALPERLQEGHDAGELRARMVDHMEAGGWSEAWQERALAAFDVAAPADGRSDADGPRGAA